MGLNKMPHIREIRNGVSVVVKEQPYRRVRLSKDTPPIFIQSGKFYYEGGTQVQRSELPEGFMDFLRDKFSAASLAKVGLDLGEKTKRGRPAKAEPVKEEGDGREGGLGQLDS